MSPSEIIAFHLSSYGSYHNHKEIMAYSGATLYIGAVTAVILKSQELLKVQPWSVVVVLLVFGILVGHAFVAWQLWNRENAANIVGAATTVLSRVSDPDSPLPDMTPTRLRDVELPRILVDEVNRAARGWALFGGARTATTLTLSAMLVWSAVAISSFSESGEAKGPWTQEVEKRWAEFGRPSLEAIWSWVWGHWVEIAVVVFVIYAITWLCFSIAVAIEDRRR